MNIPVEYIVMIDQVDNVDACFQAVDKIVEPLVTAGKLEPTEAEVAFDPGFLGSEFITVQDLSLKSAEFLAKELAEKLPLEEGGATAYIRLVTDDVNPSKWARVDIFPANIYS